jgi:hypothetical protein
MNYTKFEWDIQVFGMADLRGTQVQHDTLLKFEAMICEDR